MNSATKQERFVCRFLTNLPHCDIYSVTIFDLAGEGERYCGPSALEILAGTPLFLPHCERIEKKNHGVDLNKGSR